MSLYRRQASIFINIDIIVHKIKNGYLHTYTKRPGAPLQNCFDLYESVTSTTPGICRGGV